MRAAGFALLVLLLAACHAPVPPSPRQDPQDLPAPAHIPAASDQALTTLTGEWRVAGIDGQPLDETYGLAVSADEKEIWWAPRCAGFTRLYQLSEGRVRFQSADGTTDGSARVVCQIGIPSRLPDVFRAIDAADRAIRTPSNAVEISGRGHSLTLFSQ